LGGLRGHAAVHAVLHNHKSAYHQSNLDGWLIGGYVVVLHCGLGLQLPSLPHAHRTHTILIGLDFRALSSHAQFISPAGFYTVLCWCCRSGQGRKGANLWLPEFLAGPLVECQGRVGNFLWKLDLQKWHTSESFLKVEVIVFYHA
jgi:hypothetical protein